MITVIQPADSPEATGQRLLCHATLRKMQSDTSPVAFQRLLGIYRNELLKRSGIILQARDRQDVASMGVCVHALKSSALSFGSLLLAEKCSQVEDFCQQGLSARVFDQSELLLILIHKTLEALDVFESSVE